MIYGEAGSGKTTALQQIALWWLDRCMPVLESYKFVFPIPLRRVQSHSIVDIICRDCHLLPERFGESLSRLLTNKSEQVLFLLDSYEELAADAEELNKLISRESWTQATVLITSRPGSDLTRIQPTPCIRAKLQNLSEEDVKEYIAHYSEGDQEMLPHIKNKFTMQFLERPINLALAWYVYMTMGSKGLYWASQTRLFSQIIVHLLTVYIGKRYPRTEVSLQNVLDIRGMKDRRLAGAKAFFTEICKLCYQALRKKSVVLSTSNSSFEIDDFLDFGLFFHIPKSNSLDLPHRLFQEFLAAVYLVLDS